MDNRWRQFEEHLSRSGLKETVLDYAVDFAERRGIAEALGVTSEIEVRAEPAPTATEAGANYPSRAPEASSAGRDKPAGDQRQLEGGSPAQAGPQAGAGASDAEALAKALAWADKAADVAR